MRAAQTAPCILHGRAIPGRRPDRGENRHDHGYVQPRNSVPHRRTTHNVHYRTFTSVYVGWTNQTLLGDSHSLLPRVEDGRRRISYLRERGRSGFPHPGRRLTIGTHASQRRGHGAHDIGLYSLSWKCSDKRCCDVTQPDRGRAAKFRSLSHLTWERTGIVGKEGKGGWNWF